MADYDESGNLLWEDVREGVTSDLGPVEADEHGNPAITIAVTAPKASNMSGLFALLLLAGALYLISQNE